MANDEVDQLLARADLPLNEGDVREVVEKLEEVGWTRLPLTFRPT